MPSFFNLPHIFATFQFQRSYRSSNLENACVFLALFRLSQVGTHCQTLNETFTEKVELVLFTLFVT